MKTFKKILSGVALASSLLFSAQTFAIPEEYRVVSAEADGFAQYPCCGHSLWLPGDGTRYEFLPTDPGVLTVDRDLGDGNGVASLTGDTWHEGDSTSSDARGWTVDFNYTGGTSIGVPKRELINAAYLENGGPVDTADWYYLPVLEGVLTGLGDNAGRTLTVTARGPAFQIGYGANGKNIIYGASGWITACEQTDDGEECYSGDINVPEPTTLALLSIGLLGFSASRRMRK